MKADLTSRPWRHIPTFLVCVIVPLVLVLNTVNGYTKFSPIDEGAHFDYVRRVTESGIPRMGDEMLLESLQFISCRGVDLPQLVLPRCGSPLVQAENFPGAGLQYEAQQPPLYYVVTAPLAKLAESILGMGTLGAMRAIGVGWLVAALLLLYHAGTLLRVNRLMLLSSMFMTASSPVVVYHTAIVSNDTAVLFYSSLLLLIAAKCFVENRQMHWWAFIVAVIACLTKSTLVIPALTFALLLLLAALNGLTVSDVKSRRFLQDSRWKTFGWTAIAMGTGSVLSAFVWNYVSRLRATIPGNTFPTFDVLRGAPVSVLTILREALVALAPLTDSYTVFGSWNGDVNQIVAMFLRIVLIGGGLAGIFVSQRTWWSVAGPIGVSCLYFGVTALGIGIWRSYDMTPGLVGRYGLVMVPLLLLVLSAGIQQRIARLVLSGTFISVGLMFAWITLRVPLP